MKKYFPFILSVALLSVVFYTFLNNQKSELPLPEEEEIQSPEELFSSMEIFLSREDVTNAKRKFRYLVKHYPDMTAEHDTWSAQIDSVKHEVDERKKQEAEIKRKEREELRKQQKASLNRLRSEKDEVTDLITYHYAGVSQYASTNVFRMHVTKDKSFIGLFYTICYEGEDWLFIDKYTIRTDHKKYEINPDKVNRDHDTRVWEWYIAVATSRIDMLRDMAESSKVIIRHHGSQYYHDRVLTQNEKNGIKYALDAYEYLKSGGR